MPTPYGLKIVESCLECKLRLDNRFCQLQIAALKDFDRCKSVMAYPPGSLLFMEGQEPRGVFVLCQGRVKLSMCSTEGKAVILNISEGGELLGLSATVSGRPYEATAETLEPCQLAFMKHDDVTRLLHQHGDLCLRAAEQLSSKYNRACEEIRSLGLAHSAMNRLAGFLIDQAFREGQAAKPQPHLRLLLSHEEIAQMIGTSRETVTRQLGSFKKSHLIDVSGRTLVIRNMAALTAAAQG